MRGRIFLGFAILITTLSIGCGGGSTASREVAAGDLAVSPSTLDFGQVEVDPAVVNLSQFETFYPETSPMVLITTTLTTVEKNVFVKFVFLKISSLNTSLHGIILRETVETADRRPRSLVWVSNSAILSPMCSWLM